MADKKGAAKAGAPTNRAMMPSYNGHQMWVNTDTGQFEAQVGTEIVTRTTLFLVKQAIDKANRGVRAIVVSRGLRDVTIVGKAGDQYRLASGIKLGASAQVLAYDESLMKTLTTIDQRRKAAEEAYNKAMAQADEDTKKALEGAAPFDDSQLPAEEEETAAADGAADGADADPDGDEGDPAADADPTGADPVTS